MESFAQNLANCPDPVSPCIPKYKATSILPDTAYFNCDLTKTLDPGLDKTGAILYKWTISRTGKPDSIASGVNIIAKEEGIYTLCYDTATGPGIPSCPRTDKVVVTKYNKKFAKAGPDMTICSGVKTAIGTTPTDPKFNYDWVPANLFVGSLNKSNPDIYYINNLFSSNNANVVVTVTNKATGCKDTDTMRVRIYPLPTVKIENLQANYCLGETSTIRLSLYSPSYKNIVSKFSINGDPQTLGAAKDTTVVINGTSLPGMVYTFSLTPSKSQVNKLVFAVTSEQGCTQTDTKDIQVNVPSSNITLKGLNNTGYCSNEDNPVPLSAVDGSGNAVTSGAFTISPFSNSISKDAANNYFFNPSLALSGTNTITYSEPKTGPSACGASGSSMVEVTPLPTPKIIGRSSVCPGSLAAEYKDTSHYAGPPVTRSWSIVAGGATIISSLNSANDSAVVNYPSTPGQAIIRVDNSNGCSAFQEYTVTIKEAVQSPPPTGDSVLCTGFDSVLYKTQPGSKYFHKWSVKGGVLDPKYNLYSASQSVYVRWNPGQPEYWLWVSDSSAVNDQCFGNSDTLKIKFTQDPFANILTPDNSTICLGLPFTLSADPAGGNSFIWNPGNLTGPSINIKPSVTTKYTLTVGKGTSCLDKTSEVTLIVVPLPGDPLPQPDFQICFEEVTDTIITAVKDSPANTLVWNKDPGVNDIFLKISGPGVYSVVQTDPFGCPKEGTITIGDNCPVRVYVPQAFSPNEDGINDSLIVFGNNHFEKFHFKIFDRWGEIIFATSDPSKTWGGNYNGTMAPAGVYPWVITYETISEVKKTEKVVKKGSVTLVR